MPGVRDDRRLTVLGEAKAVRAMLLEPVVFRHDALELSRKPSFLRLRIEPLAISLILPSSARRRRAVAVCGRLNTFASVTGWRSRPMASTT